ncbi:hypothetical protein [Synechocystis sp. PCC 7338]|uniref:hypothetical protein n=1 Tax=Synechocystis sp. PCC 7338 TaxID=2732530 RepID=UPI001BB0AE01|nr:hypothetical protein [Synechocystis sp. PCC 7338]QUS61609.1 hypothetical protein HTZ78_13715 [Synechocystis sp. PCC 7338]
MFISKVDWALKIARSVPVTTLLNFLLTPRLLGQGGETALQLDTIIAVNHGGQCLALEVFHCH